MYDTTVQVTYEDTVAYQDALLAVFKMTEYSDELATKIVDLCTSLELDAPEMEGVAADARYLLLFSYDKFKETHETVCKMLNSSIKWRSSS